MDPTNGLTSRWGKRYFKARGPTEGGAKEESKYLLEDDEISERESINDIELLALPWNNNTRTRKAKEEDNFEADEVLVSIAGRPPVRPPNDQCVEAEIQPEDTLASLALKYNVPVAELKRVNRLLNENDFYAKNTIKIPIKTASLLTEILPFSERPKNSVPANWNTKTPARSRSTAAIADVHSDGSLRGSPDPMVAPTPEVRRAQRLLHKIDDSVRNISQRQEDRQQEMGSLQYADNDVSILTTNEEKQSSWLDRLNTNKKWICFYFVIIAAAFLTVWMLTKYERGVIKTHTEASKSH